MHQCKINIQQVNEKAAKTFENRMNYRKFFSLGSCIAKLQCILMHFLMVSIHAGERRIRILILLGFFSAKSANSIAFRMRILLEFSLRSLPTLPFQKFHCFDIDIFLGEVYHAQKTSYD